MHEQRFQRVAHAGPLHLAVERQFLGHPQIRALVHVFVIRDDVVVPVVDLLLLLMAAEALRSLDAPNDIRLYALSFALLLAATAYRPGILFLLAFVAYVGISVMGLMVGHLRRKAERHHVRHIPLGRGLVLTSIYAALQVLDPTDTVVMDGSLGGVGGCPYCGNGRATGMVPTEDLMHMLETMGIDTGVDIDKLIDCVWLVEEIIGRRSFGHIATAGPLPMTTDKWYPMDLPFIETLEQAKHFKLGPKVYEGCMRPWREPIRSPRRPEV